jgi:CHAD domain-containing protein
MAFRFYKSESPAKAVRRVCRERVGVALACLRQPGHPEAVHGARKEIKKLRALFRLVRGEISASQYRKVVKALRAAAIRLAATRDARVTLKAFENLNGCPAARFAGIEGVLKKHAHREARRFDQNDAVTRVARLLRKAGRRADHLKITATGWPAIAPGLSRSYQRGREFYRRLRRKPVTEKFHDWRKHVKDLWYYSCLLQPVWVAAREMRDELELLGEQLGEEHDLLLLQQFVAERCATEAVETNALNGLIDARRKRLRAAALKLGARLYAETPAAFCRRLGKLRS